MQLLTYDELTAEQHLGRALVQMTSFGAPSLPEEMRLYRRRKLYADYVGVFAVEGGEVLGQTYVRRFPYTFPDGEGELSGVAGVITRPDHARGGIARRILEEVHRRECEEGMDRIALWTNRSWGAHRLYEKLGYADIHHPTLAARFRPAKGGPRRSGTRVRAARSQDVRGLERLHRTATRGRLGFTPRHARSLETTIAGNGPEMLRSMWVATQGSELRGYAYVERGTRSAWCSEFLALDAAAERALVEQVERIGAGRYAGFYMSPASDRVGLLQDRGYGVLTSAWIIFMGAHLRGRSSSRSMARSFGTDRPGWVCHRNDRF